MSNIIKSFSFKEDKQEAIKKFDDIASKEGKKFSELLVEIVEDYVKKHGDGNPAFTLDQFQDPDFKVCPAFFRDSQTWDKYLSSLNKQEFKEVEAKLNSIIMSYKKASKVIL